MLVILESRLAWYGYVAPDQKPETGNNPYYFQIVSRVLYPAPNHRQISTAPGLWNSKAAQYLLVIRPVVGFEPMQVPPHHQNQPAEQGSGVLPAEPPQPLLYNLDCFKLGFIYHTMYLGGGIKEHLGLSGYAQLSPKHPNYHSFL